MLSSIISKSSLQPLCEVTPFLHHNFIPKDIFFLQDWKTLAWGLKKVVSKLWWKFLTPAFHIYYTHFSLHTLFNTPNHSLCKECCLLSFRISWWKCGYRLATPDGPKKIPSIKNTNRSWTLHATYQNYENLACAMLFRATNVLQIRTLF